MRLGSTHVGWDSLGFWYRLNQTVVLILALIYTICYSLIYQVKQLEYKFP